jgi:LPS-assembly lipoprotein
MLLGKTKLTPILAAVLAVGLLAPALSGCGYQPLYGSGFAGDSGVAEKLRAVDIGTIPGRVGQVVRNELIFKTTGGRDAEAPKYRLEIAMRESAQSQLVNLQGDAKGQIFGLDADFKLVSTADQKVMLDSKANARAAYENVVSTFANLRARRDAEDRAARMMADSIRTQVAAFLSTTG